MPITLSAMTPGFAAEVGDIDLAQPLSAADEQAIRAAFTEYGVLIFTAQTLTAQQHLDFAKIFGPLERSVASIKSDCSCAERCVASFKSDCSCSLSCVASFKSDWS